MEKTIYNKNGGLGIILDETEQESDFFLKKDFVINGETIRPEDFTTLSGIFSSPVRYVGALKGEVNCHNELNCMVFYLGEDEDLLETRRYYSCFYRLNEFRLANKYMPYTVRDFTFVNGEWK